MERGIEKARERLRERGIDRARVQVSKGAMGEKTIAILDQGLNGLQALQDVRWVGELGGWCVGVGEWAVWVGGWVGVGGGRK